MAAPQHISDSESSRSEDEEPFNFDTDDHLIPLVELEKWLETNFLTGLSDAEAAARLEKNGPNTLSAGKRTPRWVKFLLTMFSGFAGLLWLAGSLCFLAYAIDVASASTNEEKVPSIT